MIDLEKAKLSPSSVFKTPREVIDNKDINKKDKIDILKQWAYDERNLLVAEEENMPEKTNTEEQIHSEELQEIQSALRTLEREKD